MAETNRFGGIPVSQNVETTNRFGGVPVGDEEEETGRNRDQIYDDTLLGEFGEGVASGLIGIGEGVAGAFALGSDIVTGGNASDKVTESAEEIRDVLGLDPEGIVGKGAEVITQYALPGVGAANIVGKLAMAGRAAKAAKAGKALGPMSKAERFGLAAKQIGGAGVADVLVTTDGATTLGDWAGSGPTQTTDLIGLEGRERTLAKLGNRLKVASEGAVIGGALSGVLFPAVAKANEVTGASKGIKARIDKAGADIENLLQRNMLAKVGDADEVTGLKKQFANVVMFGRYGGALPRQVAEEKLLVDAKIRSAIQDGEVAMQGFEKAAAKYFKSIPPGGGALDEIGVTNQLHQYLGETGDVKARALKNMPKEVRQHAIRMGQERDKLAKYAREDSNVAKSNTNFTSPDGKTFKQLLDETMSDGYLRRTYKVFTDSKYKPDEKSLKAAKDYFKSEPKNVERELNKIAKRDLGDELPDDFLVTNGLTRMPDNTIKVTGQVTDAVAAKVRDSFLNQYQLKNRNAKMGGGRIAENRLDTGMFLGRKEFAQPLRQLMGEISDPKEAYLKTIADLAQFNAVDEYFGTIAQMAKDNTGIGKLFRNGEGLSEAQAKNLTDQGFVKLGGEKGKGSLPGPAKGEPTKLDDVISQSGWGSLDNHYVPRDIYNSLTNSVMAEDHWGTNALRATFGTFLKGKAISQYSKTILSPITQVRNFLTASLFAVANGNVPVIGRGSNLNDARKIVWANIMNKGDDAVLKDLTEAQQLGVMGTNTELREIQDALNKGLDLTAREPRNFVEALTNNKTVPGAGATAKAVNFTIQKTGKGLKAAEDVYQASDDMWKYFSYHAEQSKLNHALEKATVKEKINYLTKNGKDLPASMQMVPLKDMEQHLDKLLKARAAQIVRDTVPNYTKGASELVRLGRRLPVGNFITFPAEILRTGFNIVYQGLDDLASPIKGIRKRGQQRLAGFATTTMVAPVAALESAYAISGVNREEMEAYKRTFAPSWQKGAVLIPIGKTPDGKIEFVNYSVLNPYDSLSRFMNRAINEADTAGATGADPTEAFTKVMFGTLGELFGPFVGEAMLTEALVDISYRGGRTGTGAKIYNPEDAPGTKGMKMFTHVLDTMLPNVLPFDLKGGEFVAGRFSRGLIGTEEGDIFGVKSTDKLGTERTRIQELVRAATSISPQVFDPKKGLEFGAFRMQQAQTNAKSMFNQKTDDIGATGEELERAFISANEAKLRVDKRYYQMFEDLRTIGMSDRDIRRVLKQNNIGSSGRRVMRGEFVPFKVSPNNRKEMRRAGILDEFPRARINEVRKLMKGASLQPDDQPYEQRPNIDTQLEAAPAPVPTTGNIFSDLVPATTQAPAPTGNIFSDLVPTLPTLPPGPTVLPNPQDQEIQRRLNP
jgi:hypothetical protein